MDFTKTIINAIKIWVNKQLSFIENKISDLEDRPSAFIQPEEPNEAPDGTLWIDTDEDSISGVGSNTAESLTFTGVVEATYNGLSPVTVNIPKVTVNGITSDENGNIEIEVGSEQVQTDWNQNDSTQPDYIKNRTHWIEGSTYHTLSDNFIPETIARTSAVEEIKTLVGETPVSEQIEAAIAEIPGVEIPEQVQSDWNQTENTAVDYIKNRPFGEVDVTQTINMDAPSFTHYSGAYWTNSIIIDEQPGNNIKKLSVTWDDVVYNDCNIVKIVRDNYIEYICGNGTIHQGIFGEHLDYKDLEEYTFEDTGEPFAIRFQSNAPMLAVYTYDEEADSGTDIVTKISIEITKTINKTIDEIYIPDTIARIEDIPEGFSGSWNDLEDKPFYEEESLTELYAVEDLAFTESSGVYQAQVSDAALNLVVGDPYVINWDGTEYRCNAASYNSITVLGNMSLASVGDDTGEPFLIILPSTSAFTIGTSETNPSHSIVIYGDSLISKTLDEKYIPNTIARVSDIPEVPEINYPVTSVNGQTGDVQIEIPSTYTKEEIDNMEFITVDEIDAICGQTIQVASATNGTF